ncbi:putative Ig domain-containing protein [Larkinella insperata]|uniref:Ig domain-containing protein n=1 Tax=Larkinella insperata TaxID=332158 RepID=A0ABW3QDW7_9BACT|nr:putative Ig domain-containing protein [Larkinella insperata]
MQKKLLSIVGFIGILLLSATRLSAQVTLSWPQNGMVFQRGQDNKASVKFIVTSTNGQAISSLQLLFYKYALAGGTQGPLNPVTGSSQGWTTVTISNAGTCQVTALVDMAGGMYKVRAKDNSGRETADFDIGVGEVFAIAGQSNASGLYNPTYPVNETGNPTFVRFFNEKDQSNGMQGFEENDPGKCPVCPPGSVNFQWYWGGVGNRLIQALNVPVAFYQNGMASTSVVEWRNSSQGRNTPFTNGTPRFVNGFPYRNLKNFLTGRARQTGLRAILWHQGENDRRDDPTTPNGSPSNSAGSFPRARRYFDVRTNSVNTAENDADVLNDLIGQTRVDLGADVPWVVAQTSRLRSLSDPLIREDQIKVIGYASHQNTNPSAPPKTFGDPYVSPYGRSNIFTGPNTDQFDDSYRLPDPDKTHFTSAGQSVVAAEWHKAMTTPYNGQSFFGNAVPVLNRGEVTGVTSVTCTPVASCNFAVTTTPVSASCNTATTLTAGCTGSDCGSVTYAWNGNGVAKTGASVGITTPATAGVYSYTVTATKAGCATKSSVLALTVNCATTPPPVVTGNFDGHLYAADCESFQGWVWDANQKNTPISVQLLDGTQVIATLTAGEFRQDLLNAGKGDGRHAFQYAIPTNLKDGLKHTLSARVTGSTFVLKSGPKIIQCQATGTPPPATNNLPQPPTVAPLTAQQGVAYSATLPAFTDPDGEALSYSLTSLPGGLSFNATSRVLSGTPTGSGTFSMPYKATDPRGGAGTTTVTLTVQPPVTQPPSSTTVTGNFEGYLDKVECGTIRGWIWDRNKPNTPMTLEFFANGTSIGTTEANIFRQDLLDAKKGNGVHGYSFTTPASLKNNTTYQISAKIKNSTYVLKGAPKTLTCSSSAARLSAGVDGGKLAVTVLGNPVTETVEVEIRGAEGQPVHLQLTDLNGRNVTEREVPAADAIEVQRLTIGRQQAGLLLLRVRSGQQAVTLKVLKQ